MTKSPSLVLAYSASHYSEEKPVETRSEHKTITTAEGYSLFTQPHSANWYVRFSVNQKQFKKSLKTSSLDVAKPRAMKLYYETIAKAEAGLKVHATTGMMFSMSGLLDKRGMMRCKLGLPVTKMVAIFLRIF
jgi:hypothetical protein